MAKSSPRPRRRDLAWNDVEALPLHGTTVMLGIAVAGGVAEVGFLLHEPMAQVACIAGCLGLRVAWLGMDGTAAAAGERDRT